MNEYHQLLFVAMQVVFTILITILIPKNETLAIKALLCQAAVAILSLIWITL
jgi:hypothetical protein